MTVKAEDGIRLQGWLILQKNAKACPTVVYLHENAGNLGMRLGYMEELYKSCNCNVLAVAYRGYSYSEGVPSEAGLKKDGHAIVQFALSCPDIDTNKIFVLGKSLGASVAMNTIATGNYDIKGTLYVTKDLF